MPAKSLVQLVIEGRNRSQKAVDSALNGLQGLSDKVEGLNDRFGDLAGGLAGVLSVAAVKQMVTDTGQALNEISTLAQVAGISAERFQELSYGARSVGVENDKLGDIFKDVQDKVGDFLSTGGGELQDFFEKIAPQVGVTADQFRTLSGPEALQLFVSSLEKANLSQSQMTFYLESIADDASRLLPLLQNNGNGFAELSKQARELGLVLSNDVVAQGVQLQTSLGTMDALTENLHQRLAIGLNPTVSELSGLMQDLSKDTQGATEASAALGAMVKLVTSFGIGIYSVFKSVGGMIGGVAASMVALLTGDFKGAFNIATEAGSDFLGTYAEGIERIDKLWSGEYAQAGREATEVQRKIKESFEQSQKTMKGYTAVTQDAVKKTADAQKSIVSALQQAIAQEQKLEQEATSKLKALKDQQIDIRKKYAERINAFNARPGGDEAPATYASAQDLTVKARAAAAKGDTESTAKLAEQAYDVLTRIKEAGGDTFGLAGMIKELERIELAANTTAQGAAEKKAQDSQVVIDQLKAQLEQIKETKVDISINPQALSTLQTQMQQLAEQLKNQFKIPVTLLPAAAPTAGAQATPAALPAFAGGGQLRGPGTGTSDSILMWGSNGEYMIRAAAVRKYGPQFFDMLNGMKLPGFASGGIVGTAGAGAAQAMGRPLTLNLPGYGAAQLSGAADVIDGLEQHFRTLALQKGTRRRGGK
jgi:hypothetical protein